MTNNEDTARRSARVAPQLRRADVESTHQGPQEGSDGEFGEGSFT